MILIQLLNLLNSFSPSCDDVTEPTRTNLKKNWPGSLAYTSQTDLIYYLREIFYER
jgi:hypothetical protein